MILQLLLNKVFLNIPFFSRSMDEYKLESLNNLDKPFDLETHISLVEKKVADLLSFATGNAEKKETTNATTLNSNPIGQQK